MEELSALCWMIITALLWGMTDPLMKLYGSNKKFEENKNPEDNNEELGSGLTFKTLSLFKRWKYLMTFLLNQLGR
jgi:hypothetical protein